MTADRPRPPSRPPVPVNQSWVHFDDEDDSVVVPLPVRANANQPPPAVGDGATLMTKSFAALTWVVEGLLPVGLAMLCGKSKTGKSWMALDISMKVAEGGKLFGQMVCHASEVLYLALEDGEPRLQDRMRKLLGHSIGPSKLHYATTWRTVDKGGLELLALFLDAHPDCRLVIIDTLGRVRGQPDGKRGVYQQDYDDIAALKAFADLRRICLLLVHHVRKAPADDVFDTINGSTGIMGACDTIWILSRHREDDFGELAVTGRDLREDGTFALRFDKETGHWQWLGKALEHKTKGDSQKIYEYLLAATEEVAPRDIAEELGLPQGTVRVALHRMKKEMKVESTAPGRWRAFGAKAKAAD